MPRPPRARKSRRCKAVSPLSFPRRWRRGSGSHAAPKGIPILDATGARAQMTFGRVARAARPSTERARGIDHVLAVESRGGRPVRDRRHLARLALAVEER